MKFVGIVKNFKLFVLRGWRRGVGSDKIGIRVRKIVYFEVYLLIEEECFDNSF